MFESIISLAAAEAPEATGTPMPFGEAMGLGGSVTLIGVLIVFLGLVCLIFITWLYPKIALPLIAKSTARKAARKEKKAAKKAAKAKAKETVIATPTEKPIETKSVTTESADDPALVAVITAAIAASLGTSSNGIVIKSLRRTSANATLWGREARSEQVYNRF
jgi:Na+-transporting methylmalonyl-CoA/oxaloacetate decarboxylase gamma subunit